MLDYHQIDPRLHVLSQIIAKANRTFVPPQEDDSHTNLYFDHLGQHICGPWIEQEERKVIFCLNLNKQAFEWRNNAYEVLQSYPFAGKKMAELEDEIASGLSDLRLSPNGFKSPLHFDIPNYDFAEKAIPALDKAALKKWQHYRQLANEACAAVLGHLQLEAEIRIWPHHFDTGIYVEPNAKLGLGVGLAMKDNLAGTAYFYLAPYALKGEVPYDQFSELACGEWKLTENWKGALLAISDLDRLSFMDQKESLYTFLRSAAATVLNRMT